MVYYLYFRDFCLSYVKNTVKDLWSTINRCEFEVFNYVRTAASCNIEVSY